jgi:hypothetical protein
MSTAAVTTMPAQPAAPETGAPRRARRTRQQSEEVARYFLAKEGSSVEKPELGAEAASEGEALIKAFQSENGVIYSVHAYKAEAEMQGGSPILVKRPVRNESAQAARK